MSSGRPVARHQSRRAALQVLYAADLSGEGFPGAFEGVAEHFDLPEGARAFAKELVVGVGTRREALDAAISQHARNWRLERMAAVDRNVLRLATYELTYTETPASVVIDEAIELAREFGTERSSGFVNGVFDAVARSVRGAGS